MEKFKTFKDLAEEIGGTITPWEPDEEFLRDFEEYMKESIRQSRINEARAIKSARDIFIY